MMGEDRMRVVYQKTVNGVDRLLATTTPLGNQGQYIISLVGVGNSFWAWPTIPAGKVIGCDFTDAPICTDDPTTNNELIYGITVDPSAVLTYQ